MSQDLLETESANCTAGAAPDGARRFSGADLAIATIFSFVLGVVTVLMALLVLRLRRKKMLCFKEKEIPSPGKWEGASTSVTKKIILKHSIKSKTTTESPEDCDKNDADPMSMSTLKEADDQDSTCTHFESVNSEKTVENVSKTGDGERIEENKGLVNTNVNVEELFEDERESSGSHFAIYTLRNSNFGAKEGDIEEERDEASRSSRNGGHKKTLESMLNAALALKNEIEESHHQTNKLKLT